MEVNSLTISKVFSNGGDVQYVLPHFQREYAWEKPNWQTLLTDILSIYEAEQKGEKPEHFMGAMVVIEDGTRSGTIPAFKLVDGQQRLTTAALLLCALSNLVESDSGLYRKIEKILINPDENGDLRYKILPTEKYGDRQAYQAIISGIELSENTESRIIQAYRYFYKQISGYLEQGDIVAEQLFKIVVQNMHVVFINLNQQERPYEIFESLNAKGKPLTQPDLVRNYIAMRLPGQLQEKTFEKHWSEIEQILTEKHTVSRMGELTAFLRHYLALQSGVLPNKDHVYARFRDRMEREYAHPDSFVGEIETLHRFAKHYNKILRPENEEDKNLRDTLRRLNILETFTAYPFLMAILDSYTQNHISRESLLAGLSALENYMMRRSLVREPTNYLNKMFPALEREVSRSDFVNSLKQALVTKNYPSDNRVRQTLKTAEIYDRRGHQKLIFIFEAINEHLSKGSGGLTVLDNAATIEHLMPQTLNEEWKRHLGNNWEETHREYLHTLGNLTLVTQNWNSQLSNSSFSVKKTKLANHALLLNREYFSQPIKYWNQQAIETRTAYLTDTILEIWPSLGDAPVTQDLTGTKPVALLVLGETYTVKTWRELTFQMAEICSDYANHFDSIAEELPASFSRTQRERSMQMQNGWWLYVNLSSNAAMSFCNRLSSMVGLSDEDWEVKFA